MEDNSHVRAGTWQRKALPCPQHAHGRGLHQRLGCHSAGPGAGENVGKPKGCCRTLCAPLGMKGWGMAPRGSLPAPIPSRTAAELHGVAQRRQRPPLPEGPDGGPQPGTQRCLLILLLILLLPPPLRRGAAPPPLPVGLIPVDAEGLRLRRLLGLRLRRAAPGALLPAARR